MTTPRTASTTDARKRLAENAAAAPRVTASEPGCTCGGMAACSQCQDRDAEFARAIAAARAGALQEAADALVATRDDHAAADLAEGCTSRFCRGWLLGQTYAAQQLRSRAAIEARP